MGRKKILAFILSLCFLVFPVLTACSSTDVQNALSSLTREDIDHANSVIDSVISDFGGNSSDTKPEDMGQGGNHGNGNGPNGNSGSGNNGNEGNGNGNNGGGNGNGGTVSTPESELPDPKPEPLPKPEPDPKPEMPKPNEPTVIVDNELGLSFTLSEDGTYFTVSAAKPLPKTRVTIPSVYNGLPVTAINANGFSGCLSLQSITIPRSIVKIGGFAFFKCENLTTITILSSVQSISAYAFDGCANLTINCEVTEAPKSWDKKWNPDNRPVVWGFACEHEWGEATCDTPYVCTICGAIDGDALGHSWENATCIEPMRCTVCGATDGDALGHAWVDATCEKAGYCEVCGEVGEEALGHCFVDGACNMCGLEENVDLTATGNVISLAEITKTGDWWACDPSYLVDGNETTATLTDVRRGFTTFTFTWNQSYFFKEFVLVANNTGYAPKADLFFDTDTKNSYEYDLVFYDENGNVVFEMLKNNTNAVYSNHISIYETASKMELTVYSNYQIIPIFEVEAYVDKMECNHSWIDATCTKSKHCRWCEAQTGAPLGHDFSSASCTKDGVCERCGEVGAIATGHLWENGICVYCKTGKSLLLPDYIESVIPSFEGEGTINLECLFDGVKETTGLFGESLGTEYFPSKTGDYLKITFKEPTVLCGTTVWTSGNYTYAELIYYDENGSVVFSQRIVYEGSINAGESTPVNINYACDVPIKVVELVAVQLKWENSTMVNKTQKTSEIEFFVQPEVNVNANKVTFGSYPQTLVTDKELSAELNGMAGPTPDASNPQKWTDYGYYINGEVASYMWYIDMEYNGEKYRGVFFDKLRPSYASKQEGADFSELDENGYIINDVYWFKYEPISWTIMKQESGIALLVCDNALDAQLFDLTSNSYEESFIRAWLNDTFYNTAFSNEEKLYITTGLSSGISDKVFLLSKEEAEEFYPGTTMKWKATTDYAQCQGADYHRYAERGHWWLRTPSETAEGKALFADQIGGISNSVVDFTSGSVVPCIVVIIE